jgi:23S rRNA U2552 (ribose-2'-O)-methylase RlmE/FtsJ
VASPHAYIIAIDVLEMEPTVGVEFLPLDFLDAHPRSAFLCKVLQGGTEASLLAGVQARFRRHQAGGKPAGIRRALSARHRVSSQRG